MGLEDDPVHMTASAYTRTLPAYSPESGRSRGPGQVCPGEKENRQHCTRPAARASADGAARARLDLRHRKWRWRLWPRWPRLQQRPALEPRQGQRQPFLSLLKSRRLEIQKSTLVIISDNNTDKIIKCSNCLIIPI